MNKTMAMKFSQKIMFLAIVTLSFSFSQTWQRQDSLVSASLYDVFFTDSVRGWAVGGSGTVIKTTNGGIDWAIKNS
ncbi:MAG TPA: YCF48-related protein, partial [Candidatus Hodarchaeales archaeon]|nr:YCF48-related protein [Candidatus Hodarchaeales archaeon]